MLSYSSVISMDEKLKILEGLYEQISTINREIAEIEGSFNHIEKLQSSIIGDDIEDSLNSIKKIIKTKIDTKNGQKTRNEELFKKQMYDIFGINIGFEEKQIVLESKEIDDPNSEKYKEILRYYVELYNGVGISDDNLFIKIRNIIDEMLHIALKLSRLIRILKERTIDFLEETDLLSLLMKHLEEYKDIIFKYRELVNHLHSNDQIPFSATSIQYIIENTSLLPLVFANNGNSPIKRNSSLKKLFLCQFHRENSPSMRVNLNTNHFICYGCGTQGTQIEYLCNIHDISYTEAIYLLAEIFLIELPDNPFREGEKVNLVDKYRRVLRSDEFESFLVASMNNTSKKDSTNENAHLTLFYQIERIKSGSWDSSFQFEPKAKRFINLPKDKEYVRELLPEGAFSGRLPF